MEKAKEFQKNIYFSFIDYAKAFDCVDQNKRWKILKEMGIPEHLTASWDTYMQVRKWQLELDMEQQTGSKQEKESRLPGEISITSNIQKTPSLWQKVKRN